MQLLSERPNLSKEIADRVRRMILDAHLAEDQRINEVHLAGELGVSRTPLREALNQLVGEGALRSEPRRGYFVQPLTAAEFGGMYQIRSLLDPEALRIAGLPDEDQVSALEEINEELALATTPDQAIEIDDHWHLTLLRHCPNPVLIDLIREFMGRTRRYELAYFREHQHQAQASKQHQAVVRAVRRKDIDAACKALRQNLTSGTRPILNWLKERHS
jgi:DNA-binding GntR family transcriptional regulator